MISTVHVAILHSMERHPNSMQHFNPWGIPRKHDLVSFGPSHIREFFCLWSPSISAFEKGKIGGVRRYLDAPFAARASGRGLTAMCMRLIFLVALPWAASTLMVHIPLMGHFS